MFAAYFTLLCFFYFFFFFFVSLFHFFFFFFFFNDTATTEIYTLSLHDALPIFRPGASVSLTKSMLQRCSGRVGQGSGIFRVRPPSGGLSQPPSSVSRWQVQIGRAHV